MYRYDCVESLDSNPFHFSVAARFLEAPGRQEGEGCIKSFACLHTFQCTGGVIGLGKEGGGAGRSGSQEEKQGRVLNLLFEDFRRSDGTLKMVPAMYD